MTKEDAPKELMKYLERLGKELEEIRDDETKRIIRDLMNQLDTLKLSKGLTYNQLEKLKGNLKEEVLDKDEYSDYSFVPNLSFYFDLDFNYMAYSTKETNLLAENIQKLINRINILNEELEDKKLKEIEAQEPEPKIETKEKPKEEDKEEELLLEDDNLEEDEEIAVSVQQFLFKCINCGNKFAHAYTSSCRKCGKNIIKVNYL